jgi:hypothetical protein
VVWIPANNLPVDRHDVVGLWSRYCAVLCLSLSILGKNGRVLSLRFTVGVLDTPFFSLTATHVSSGHRELPGKRVLGSSILESHLPHLLTVAHVPKQIFKPRGHHEVSFHSAPAGGEEPVDAVAMGPGFEKAPLHHLAAACGEEVSRRFLFPALMPHAKVLGNPLVFLRKDRTGGIHKNPPESYEARGMLQQLPLKLRKAIRVFEMAAPFDVRFSP